MGSNIRSKDGNARRKAVAWLKSQRRDCWICEAFGRPAEIDYSLPGGHPLSFECDELIPVSKGGSPTERSNLGAAHRRCNQWRSNRSVEEVLRIARNESSKAQRTIVSSKKWL